MLRPDRNARGMRPFSMLAAMALAAADPATAAAPEEARATATLTGIPLDQAWKAAVYGFAREKLLHPAWGWTHSERDYGLARDIAAREGLRIDPDVLFAAAFVHDMGAIGEFQKEGVDHAVRSAELAEPLLRDAGFPMAKWPAVRDAILGHMHDKMPSNRPEATVLHDADTLDFLGTVGVARRLSVTGEAPDYAGGLARIRDFADKLPGRLVTATAKRMAGPRAAEMHQFLDRLNAQTNDGRLP
jgi:uncharacterized protein